MDKHASINRAFRLVWSAARGTYVVAPETAGGRGRGGRSCGGRIGTSIAAGIAVALGTAWCGGPGSDALAQVVRAPTTVVPTGSNTRAYVNPNGVPVVNIATPNAAGLSHNQYIQYNVDSRGLVLNNTTGATGARSQLAGQVQGNLNLSAPAQVILNQVVAPNRSTLAGFTEVLGSKADVIVANPYGITCSGCGFLNTDRVTLTTGTPVVGGDSVLSGFAVSAGDILVNGLGLNASNQQILDLVTRSVRLDGQVNVAAAGSVGVATGPNQWSYATRDVTGTAAPTANGAPTFAIDSTALGGVYGGRIRIIATEAGVGVRMHGDMAASADDFTLSSAGKVDFRAKAVAQRDVVVASSAGGADALALTGAQLSAARDLRLQAGAADGGVALNGGVLVAGANLELSAASLADSATTSALADNNKRYAASAATLRTSAAAQLDGVSWGAGGALGADLGSLQVGSRAATLSAGTTLGITTTGDMALEGAAVLSAADLSLAAGGRIRTTAAAGQGVQSSAGALSLAAGAGLENAGTIAASDGSITARVDGTLSNSGSIYSRGNLSVTDRAGGAGATLANRAGGAVLADGALSIRATQASNAGTLQGLGGTTLTAGSLDNSGTFIASDTAGADALLDVGTLDNSGVLQARRHLAVNLTGTSLSNSGTVIAGADLTIRSQGTSLQLENDAGGVLQAGSAGTLSVAGNGVTLNNAAGSSMIADRQALAVQTLQNAGVVQGGSGASTAVVAGTLTNTGTLNLATSSAGSGAITANALSNSGTVQSAGAATLDVASAIDNTASGVLLADRLQLSSASLTNAGVVQGGSGASSLAISGAASNSGTLSLATSSSGSGTLTAQQLTNSGTLQSAGAATLDVATSITNTAAGRVMADRLSLSAAGLSNAGVVQGGTGASTLAVAGTLSNEGTVSLATAVAGSGTINARQISNTGTVQSAGSAALNVEAGLSNAAAAKVLAGTSLTVRGTAGVYAVDNQGRMEAGGLLDVKGQGGGNAVTIGVGATGVMRAQTMALNAQNLTIANGGQVGSSGNMTVDAQSLVLGGSTARIVGATAGGTTAVTSASAFSNPGAIHSGGHLTLSAPSLQNTSTGGISALGNLTLTASSGNLDNSGALYAGADLTASAAGTLTNAGSLSSQIGTIDSGGAINLNAATFVNNSTIRAGGAVTVDAGTFRNEVQGGDTRSWVEVSRSTPDDSTEANAYRVDNWYAFPDQYKNEFFRETWRMEQRYANDVAPSFTPQIIGGTAITIRNFSGSANGNRGANISAPAVTLSGSGTFTNDSLALLSQDYQKTWERYTHYVALGPLTYESRTKKNESGQQLTAAGVVSSRSAGIYATTLNASGFALSVLGPQYGAAPAATSASAPGAGAPAPTTTLAGTTAAVINVTPAGATSSITFGGISIALPSNPNGYFVLRPDASASYLVETNPLFAAGSNLYGSAYLAEQFGLKPEELSKRLGDSNYEAYLIRQQLLAQTGRVLLAGYQQEADLLQAMMTRGAAEAKRLGFSWGDAPTNDKLAQLTQDVVWMVKVRVAGQDVLTPVVYLSQATVRAIATGSVMQADTTTLDLDSLTVSGANLGGKQALTVRTKDDITIESGLVSGGDVSLASAQGKVVVKTWSQGDGILLKDRDGKQVKVLVSPEVKDAQGNVVTPAVYEDMYADYKTSIGRTAGIQADGNLSISAAKDIEVTGATLSAGKDASLQAGGALSFGTVANKNATSTHSKGGILAWTTSGESSTMTQTHLASAVTTGGSLTLGSEKDMTFTGTKVDVGGDLQATSKGALRIGAAQDTTTSRSVSRIAGLGVGGGVFGSQTTVTESFEGKNVGSAFTVGGNAAVRAGNDLTVEGSSLKAGGAVGIVSENGNVKVLDGKDARLTTTTTTTETFFKVVAPTRKESDAAVASSRELGSKDGTQAVAYADKKFSEQGGFNIFSKTTTTTVDNKVDSIASAIEAGGDVTVRSAQKDVAIRGSRLQAGGRLEVDAAGAVDVLAGQSKHTVDTSVSSTAVGIYYDVRSNHSTEAGGQAINGNVRADTQNRTENDAAVTIGVRLETSTENKLTLRHAGSQLSGRGDVAVRAGAAATFEAAQVTSGGNLTIAAKDLVNLAAHDEESVSKTFNQKTVGVSVDVRSDSQAYERNRATMSPMGTPGGGAKALVDNKSELSVGLRYAERNSASSEGTTNAVVNEFRAGGDVTRTATGSDSKGLRAGETAGGTITDQGTRIAADRDIAQSAASVTETAIHDTAWKNTSELNHDTRVGVYIGHWREHIKGRQAGAGGVGGNMAANTADTTVGARAYSVGNSSASESRREQAVTSSYVAGRSVASSTTGATTLIGTKIEAGRGVALTAGTLDYQAAQDKTTRTGSGSTWKADVRAGKGFKGASSEKEYGLGGMAEAIGVYDTLAIRQENTVARVGQVTAGGAVSVTGTGPSSPAPVAGGVKGGDVRLQGTSISAAGDVAVKSNHGDVALVAAQDTQLRQGEGWNLTTKLRGTVTTDVVTASVSAGLENIHASTRSTATASQATGVSITSRAGSVALEADGKLLAEGASVDAKGAASLKGKEIALNESKNTQTLDAFGHSGMELAGGSIKISTVTGLPVDMNASAAAGLTFLGETKNVQTGKATVISAGTIALDSRDVDIQGTKANVFKGKLEGGSGVQENKLTKVNDANAYGVDINLVGGLKPSESRFVEVGRVDSLDLAEQKRRVAVEEIKDVRRLAPREALPVPPAPAQKQDAAGVAVPAGEAGAGTRGASGAQAPAQTPAPAPAAAPTALSTPMLAFTPTQTMVPPVALLAAQAPAAPVAALQAPAAVPTPATAVQVAKPVMKAPVATPPKGPKKPRRRN